MEDEIERLRQSAALRDLLGHYAKAPELEAWQDRLMQVAGLGSRELVILHGELLAHNWLRQNSGALPAVRPGAVLGCYRATRAGRYALLAAAQPSNQDDEKVVDAA